MINQIQNNIVAGGLFSIWCSLNNLSMKGYFDPCRWETGVVTLLEFQYRFQISKFNANTFDAYIMLDPGLF